MPSNLDERIDKLEYLVRRDVATWEDRKRLAELKRERAEMDYEAGKRLRDLATRKDPT